MPHIIVKMYPGRTEEQKIKLTEGIVKVVEETTKADPAHITVCIEEIEPKEWNDKVYKPDIIEMEANLYKKPDYKPE